MSQETTAASQPAAVSTAPISDVQQRRGNVSVDRLTAILAQGERAKVQSGPATIPDPIPEKSTPVAATKTPPETPAAPEDSKPASTEASTAKPSEDVATTQNEEAATETQDGEEEVLSQDPKDQKHKLSPEQQEIVNKRIGKEVAKTKRLSSELEALKAEVESLKASKPEPEAEAPIVVQPTPDNPLAHVQDAATLEKEIQNARAYKYWAEDALDSEGIENGYVYQGQTFSKSQIKEIRRNATRILEEFAPARSRFLEQKSQVAQKAVESFPFLKDRNSPDYVLAQQIRREFPELSLRPNGDLIVAEIVKGRRAIEAEKASAGKTPAASTKTRATAPKAHAETPAAVPSSRATDDEVQQEQTKREVQQIRGTGNLSTKKLAEMLLKTSALKR